MKRSLHKRLLVLFFILAQSAAEKCTPGEISTISFTDGTLKWTDAENTDDCPINWYGVYLTDIETDKKLEVLVPATVTNYTFTTLELCKKYKFQVFAISQQNVPGPHKDDTFETTVADDIDLALGHVNVTEKFGEIDLEWKLEKAAVSRCIAYFKVGYSNTFVHIQDPKYEIMNVVPCEDYAIELNAVVVNSDGSLRTGPVKNVLLTSTGQAPSRVKVRDLITTTRTVDFIFEQQSYKDNPCQMSTIAVSTPGAASDYASIVAPIFDDPDDGNSRPEIEITVSGLQPNTLYTSIVTLENEVGTSDPVTIFYRTDKDSN